MRFPLAFAIFALGIACFNAGFTFSTILSLRARYGSAKPIQCGEIVETRKGPLQIPLDNSPAMRAVLGYDSTGRLCSATWKPEVARQL